MKKGLGILLGLVVLYAIGLLFVSGPLLRYGLDKQLHKYIPGQYDLGRISVNVFKGEVLLDRFVLRPWVKLADTTLEIKDLQVNLEYLPLMSRELHLSLHLSGLFAKAPLELDCSLIVTAKGIFFQTLEGKIEHFDANALHRIESSIPALKGEISALLTRGDSPEELHLKTDLKDIRLMAPSSNSDRLFNRFLMENRGITIEQVLHVDFQKLSDSIAVPALNLWDDGKVQSLGASVEVDLRTQQVSIPEIRVTGPDLRYVIEGNASDKSAWIEGLLSKVLSMRKTSAPSPAVPAASSAVSEASAVTPEEKASPAEDAASSLGIRVGKLVVENGSLKLLKREGTLKRVIDLTGIALTAEPLVTPEHRTIAIRCEAGIPNTEGKLALSCDLNPMLPPYNFTLAADLSHVPVRSFNQFYDQQRFPVRSGEFSLRSEGKCENSELLLHQTLTCQGLEFNPGGASIAGIDPQQIVKALQDKEGALVFTFDVNGNLESKTFGSNFHLQDVLTKAITKTLESKVKDLPELLTHAVTQTLKDSIAVGGGSIKDIGKSLENNVKTLFFGYKKDSSGQ